MHRSRPRLEWALALGLALSVPASGAAADPQRGPETPIVVRVEGGGFGWTDAGIGALAGVGGTLALVGGAALARSARPGDTPTKKGVRR